MSNIVAMLKTLPLDQQQTIIAELSAGLNVTVTPIAPSPQVKETVNLITEIINPFYWDLPIVHDPTFNGGVEVGWRNPMGPISSQLGPTLTGCYEMVTPIRDKSGNLVRIKIAHDQDVTLQDGPAIPLLAAILDKRPIYGEDNFILPDGGYTSGFSSTRGGQKVSRGHSFYFDVETMQLHVVTLRGSYFAGRVTLGA